MPCILRTTRYFRGVALRKPFQRLPIAWLLDHAADTRARFLDAGYAWVDVCARGSGASFGTRPSPWSADEIADGREIVAWIVAQPWSDGMVGATGVSYDGTASDFLAVAGHPAVRAICPRYSLFDTYTDVAFPGGIHLRWFTAAWASFNRALDAGRLDRAFAKMARVQVRAMRDARPPLDLPLSVADNPWAEVVYERVVRLLAAGVQRVDDDDGGALLAAAIAEHAANYDVHAGAERVAFRDDLDEGSPVPGTTIDTFSPHAHLDALRRSGVAALSWSGWADAAYQHGAMKRFRNVPGGGLIVGPWDHGGTQNVSPYAPTGRTGFDAEGEMLRFFDEHLRGRGGGAPPVRYFVCGEERWRTGSTWPPPSRPHRLHLARERSLRPDAPSEGTDRYRVDPTVGTGHRSRWDSLLGILAPVGHGDRATRGRRMLVYRSEPLRGPLTIAGHPLLSLEMGVDADDTFVFAYLEDEDPKGYVRYVTEGQLRAVCRARGERAYVTEGPPRSFRRADARPLERGRRALVELALLPIAWRFAAGHRIRLALAGADADHFVAPPAVTTWDIAHGRDSWLEVPELVP